MIKIQIYALINPIDHSVFYIGATSGPLEQRLSCHISEYQPSLVMTSKKTLYIGEILKAGFEPEILLLDLVDVKDASFYEVFYMYLFKSYGFTLYQKFQSTYSKIYHEGNGCATTSKRRKSRVNYNQKYINPDLAA